MQNIYTVAQVNAYIRNMFTQDFMMQSLFVRGEVSNCKYHSTGHIYFTLKDEKGAIACVMFAGNRSGLKFRLENGQQVVVGGMVDVYERDGKYQLYAKQIVQEGAGYLYEKFEALKNELAERGMFAEQYKRPIPAYIKTLGVVTAPTGAAVRDIINVAKRRNPYIRIILYPAIVQGDMAAQSIVNGIHALAAQGVDTMIVGRGGGSLEDLWAFNEEIVAQAVFDCEVPIISAVGHETDHTIIDYVADLRAPTPSAAAELAVFDYSQFVLSLHNYREKLTARMDAVLLARRQRTENLALRYRLQSPESRIRDKRLRVLKAEEDLQRLMEDKLKDNRHRLALYVEKFKGLSPLAKLNQGYSYVEDKDGRALKHLSQVHPGDMLTINVSDGKVLAQVKDKISPIKAIKERKNDHRGEIC
ncbi:MAG: exodeoxyribonuclease VII large subunit [Lachnospiraceae bacterium]|nr:exodeoxyribonuclease VII large subunit [Lachnospiraceae bacterium]